MNTPNPEIDINKYKIYEDVVTFNVLVTLGASYPKSDTAIPEEIYKNTTIFFNRLVYWGEEETCLQTL